MNRSQEIIKIFSNILTKDIILTILQIEKKQKFKEAMDYWIDIIPIYRVPISKLYHCDRYHLQHIKRVEGSVQNVNDENRDIKYLRLCNHKWLIAWNNIRFKI